MLPPFVHCGHIHSVRIHNYNNITLIHEETTEFLAQKPTAVEYFVTISRYDPHTLGIF